MKNTIVLLLFPFFMFGQTQFGQEIDGEASNDSFGVNVSLSDDGNIIAISGPGNDVNAPNSGHARVYKKISNEWVQIGTDIDGDNNNDQFGVGLSLSGNGNTLAVGAIMLGDTGYTRVFENIEGVWIQIGGDIIGENPGDSSGFTVDISNNGNIVAIASPYNNSKGHVRIYENIQGDWVQIGDDIDGEASGDLFGGFYNGISLSGDGNIIAIGAQGNDANNADAGQVRVYINSNGTWIQLGDDINGTEENDKFGYSVSLSNDGNIVAIGAPNESNGQENSRGKVSVFVYSGGSWLQLGDNINGEEINDRSGTNVKLSDNGLVLAIGAINNNGGGFAHGHVRMYEYFQGEWTQLGEDINGSEQNDKFGSGVSLSSNGNIIAVGAPNAENNGKAYVYFLLKELSINNNSLEDGFTIYPNPATKNINIVLEKDIILSNVVIYNSLGQILKIEDNLTIDTSIYLSGTYYFQVTTNQGISTRKIILE